VRGRIAAGLVMELIGIVWILQGLNIRKGDGMSGHGIWAVLGAILVFLGSAMVIGAFRARAQERRD
jgi:hypothetical protein